MGVYIFKPEDLLRYGTITEEQLELLKDAIEKKADILIVGGTRAGKTKLVEALVFLIPDDWKVAVVTAYNEFKPFKENIQVINTEFDGRSLDKRTEEVIDAIQRINPDYVIIDTIHTVKVSEMLRRLIDKHGFIVTSLVLSRNLSDEIKHWLKIDDELLSKFELVIELYRDIKTGLRKVNAIYRIKGGRLEKIS
ncbi:P-loop NTPase family protein [Pyrococcus abyssi]|uniref:Predicted ATPase n=1 Tax=Pyrococcus abyssi (strain GE5 / Orsay) TaxID=272844 RepID=Q9V0F1_PYRAB|nr:type II/IV secretion system ATPase subunit [Pyrococcus abyssi]CAB49752.1 Predicted ATPase [Pyrococcus abyssi GE5]CCE70242.1 TPA: type II secretion system protein, putative [Pyrococcus abyssi GE5]